MSVSAGAWRYRSPLAGQSLGAWHRRWAENPPCSASGVPRPWAVPSNSLSHRCALVPACVRVRTHTHAQLSAFSTGQI